MAEPWLAAALFACAAALILQMKTTNARYAPAPASNRAVGDHHVAPAPVKNLRLGRLKAAIWENTADQRTFYNVKFTRTYMDEQKKFHDSDAFGRDDLLLLSKLADQAHTFICERQMGARNDEPAG
jgi:hypothetical protein